MAHDVFISYATEDKRVADAVCAAIEARGFRCWMAPRDVLAGTSYGEAITKAIQNSRAMVLVFSSHANTSPHIPKEIERAVTRQAPIIPFRVEDVPPSDALDYFISSVHWLDAIGGPLDGHLGRLADAVEQTLAGSGPSAAKPAVQRATLWGKISSLPAAGIAGARALGRRPAVLSMSTLVLGAAIAGLVVWDLKPGPSQVPQPLARMVITPPGERLLGGESGNPAVTLSPDGSRIVLVVRQGGATQLFIRRLDQPQFTAISGTEGALNPFFSPDGQWIAFFSVPETKIEKVSVAGGAPQIVCDATLISGATWGPNDGIIFSRGQYGDAGLYQVPAAGGTPRVLTTLDSKQGEIGHTWPYFLPDGKSILFAVRHSGEGPDDGEIVVQSLETGARRVLVKGGTQPRYAASGDLIFVRAGTLMAAPFSLARLELTGAPVAIEDGLSSGGFLAQFTFSNAGWLVYEQGGDSDSQLRRLVWVDRKGVAQPLAAPPRRYQFPRLSPGGGSVAVRVLADRSDIWIYDLTRDTLTRLTSQGNNSWPIWTPDGKRVTFTSNEGGHDNLFWKLADGSGPEERLTTSEHAQTARSWSPNGQELVFTDSDPATDEDIWVLPLQGSRMPRPFLRTPFQEGWAQLSPDGRWLAYVSKELARSEVYVQPFPDGGARWQISTAGATEPVWSRDGRELFYRDGDKMMAVNVTTQATFSAGKPRLLFESAEYERVSTTPNYDVSLDGQRFLMVQASEQPSVPQLDVVVNWFEELKQKVPTGTK